MPPAAPPGFLLRGWLLGARPPPCHLSGPPGPLPARAQPLTQVGWAPAPGACNSHLCAAPTLTSSGPTHSPAAPWASVFMSLFFHLDFVTDETMMLSYTRSDHASRQAGGSLPGPGLHGQPPAAGEAGHLARASRQPTPGRKPCQFPDGETETTEPAFPPRHRTASRGCPSVSGNPLGRARAGGFSGLPNGKATILLEAWLVFPSRVLPWTRCMACYSSCLGS